MYEVKVCGVSAHGLVDAFFESVVFEDGFEITFSDRGNGFTGGFGKSELRGFDCSHVGEEFHPGRFRFLHGNVKVSGFGLSLCLE